MAIKKEKSIARVIWEFLFIISIILILIYVK